MPVEKLAAMPALHRINLRFNQLNADVFCLQETKLQEGQIDLDLPGYHQYWNYAEKKGYSGVAVFSRQELSA